MGKGKKRKREENTENDDEVSDIEKRYASAIRVQLQSKLFYVFIL